MKITLDTKLKEVSLHENVNVEELFATLENFLPSGLWKEFKINVNPVKEWTNPIIIPYTPVYPYNPNPFPLQPFYRTGDPIPCTYPWITTCQNTDTNDVGVTFTALNDGVYNVEFEK